MRHGDWIQTISGRKFYPLDPRPEDVHLEDIAHSLSMTCRFVGHCKVFYSVAQHSVLIQREMAPLYSRAALLHDAAEAYIGDVSRPLKKSLYALVGAEVLKLKAVENSIKLAICTALHVDIQLLDTQAMLDADMRMLATEARDLMHDTSEWASLNGFAPYPHKIAPLKQVDAYAAFMAAWRK